MENIILPSTIDFQETDSENVGRIEITPCHQGYGTTIGNALRRVLLSSLPGAAVESIKIEGVQHEFSGIEGVEEDVIEIILNLKQLAVRSYSDEPVVLTLTKKGKGPVKASDIEKNADVEVINKDLVIAHVSDDSKTFEMELTIGQGRGFVPVSQKDTKGLDLGRIAIDSLYTPINDIGYNVESTRVGDVTDYEKLVLTIETNGTLTAKEAIIQATQILMSHFSLILDSAEGKSPVSTLDEEVEDIASEQVEEAGKEPKEEKEEE
ncbi:MAG: DNA-directed RNA polymerase subunit alpha [Candidatus Magasanikbacteria bacterium]